MAAQVLAVLEPAALELNLAAADDIEQERARLHRNWQQQVERARYEAERAQRQYDAVEPENRLVARELERRWEEALKEQRRLEEEYARFSRNQPEGLSAGEREQIRALARDLPALWQAPTTTAADRQRIVRLLVKEVVVTVRGESEWVDVTIHWAGGFEQQPRVGAPGAALPANGRLREAPEPDRRTPQGGTDAGRGGRAVEPRGLSSPEAIGDVHERDPGRFARQARSSGSASAGRGRAGRPG